VKGKPGITRGVAQFVAATGFKDLPEDVLEAAKKAFLDCFGVAIAGGLEPVGQLIISFAREVGSKPIAGVLGGGYRTDPSLAALANGTLAHALDYDDGGALPLPFHPSVPVFPVVLALGEAESAPGRDILLAYILGVEVETKIAASMKQSHFARGWHPTATVGTLGATAAAAKLLRLDTEQTETALGIASSLSGGLRHNFGTMTKPLHAGSAAKHGVMAATLAKRGFDAGRGILEARGGFFELFAGKGQYSTKKLIKSMGRPFHFAYPGVAIKKYPSCRGTHAAIEALSELIKVHKISSGDIDKVECSISSVGGDSDGLSRPRVTTGTEGKFSLKHCLGVLMVDGEVGLRQFSPERILAPQVAEMRQRVKILPRSDLLSPTEMRDHMAARVTVRLKDGRQVSHFYCQSKKEMGVPWSWEDLKRKFEQCAGLALPRERVERLEECLRHLEKVEKTSPIVDLALGPFKAA